MHKIERQVPMWDSNHPGFLTESMAIRPITRHRRLELAVELLIEDIRSYELST